MLLIQNGTLVTEQGACLGDVAIENGKIVRIAAKLQAQAGDESIDASGLLVFPGFIDAHVHFEMQNALATTADSFETGTRAAIAGGTTTVIHFATQDRGHTLREELDKCLRQATGNCSCHFAFHMSVTDWNEASKAELDDMFAAGVSSFKIYFAYDSLRISDAATYELLTELKKRGGLLGVHCENGDLVDEGISRQKALGHLNPAAHAASRPPIVEAEAVNRLLAISELTDCAVNIVHLSGREGLEAVRRLRAKGKRVYVETCPQYFTLNDACYEEPDFGGAKYVCSPPVRSEGDRQAIEQALLAGEIDTIATDHCSYTLAQKALGRDDFSRIPNGLPGVEHRASLVYTNYVFGGRMSATQMSKLLSTNPAREYGMYPQKGTIAVGSDADLVLWNPSARGVISAKSQYQNTDYTPYEGREVVGAAKLVLLGGRVVVKNGVVANEKCGRYVSRKPVEV